MEIVMLVHEIKLSAKEHAKFCDAMHKKLDSEGLSVKEFSKEIGVKPQSIYNFENDKTRNPSKFLAAKIANALKIDSKEYRIKSSFFCLIPLLILLFTPVDVKAVDIYDEVFGVDSGTDFVPGYYEPIVSDDIPLTPTQQIAIKKICENKEVSYPIMLALMEKESNFTPDVVSKDKRNYGICQISPKFFECEDCFDVIQNVDSATDYIQALLDKYEGDYEMALQKYNGQEVHKGKKSKYSTWILERSLYYEGLINN